MIGWAQPAVALGDDGVLDVLVAEAQRPNTIGLEVVVPYTDGDLASDARVTARLTRPGAAALTLAQLRQTPPGSYAADITVPGGGLWTVVVTSTSPAAEATIEIEVPGGATQASAAPSQAIPTAPATRTPPPSRPGESTTSNEQSSHNNDDVQTSASLIAGAVSFALVGVLVVTRRSRSRDPVWRGGRSPHR